MVEHGKGEQRVNAVRYTLVIIIIGITLLQHGRVGPLLKQVAKTLPVDAWRVSIFIIPSNSHPETVTLPNIQISKTMISRTPTIVQIRWFSGDMRASYA